MKRIILSVLAGILIVVLFALVRVNKIGAENDKLSLKEKIYCGIVFPVESKVDSDYTFKSGDILVMYRPACPDCQAFIGSIKKELKGEDVLWLSDTSDRGKALYDPEWVPSVIFFKHNSIKTIEIRDKNDLVELREYLREFKEKSYI